MTTQEVRYRLAVEGAQETAQGFDQVNQAMARQSAEKAKLASQDAAGQAFLGSLREQAALYNKSADDALRYRAAQLGVSQAAGPLILQLQNQRAAQEAAAKASRAEAEALRESAAAKRASESAQASFVRSLREQADLYGKSQAEILRYRAAQLGIGQGAEKYIQQIERQTQATGRLGTSVGQTRVALAQLPAQFTDIFTSLAGGQNPLLVFIQQGGQIRDSFGGIRGALQGVLSIFTPLRVAVGGVVGIFGGLALAAFQGSEEVAKFNRTLAITGNAAGLTADRFRTLSRDIADSTNTGIGGAKDTLLELAATGRLSGEALRSTAEAAQRLALATGDSASAIGKRLLSVADDAARGAATLNKQYNFLSVEQFKVIQNLQAQGRLQEAVAFTMQALSERIGDQTANLGFFDRAWRSVAGSISEAWNALKRFGQADTIGDQIAALQRGIDSLESEVNDRAIAGDTRRVQVLQDQLKVLRERQSVLQSDARLQAKSADDQARNAAANQKAIDDLLKAPTSGAADTYANLLREINAVTTANNQRLAAGGELTRVQQLEASLNEKLADSLKRLSAPQQAAARSAVERAIASQRAVDAQEAERKSAEGVARARADLRRQEEQGIEAFLDKQRQAADQSLKSVQDRLAGLQDEEKALGLATLKNISLAEAIEEVAIARLREQQARLQAGSEGFEAIEREIAARRQLQAELAGKAQREAAAESAKSIADATIAEFDRIRSALTDVIFQGGKSGKDLLVGLFKTLVLRPVVDIPARAVAGVLAGGTGTAFAATGAGGDVLGLASTLGKLTSLPDAIGRSIGLGAQSLAQSSIGQSLGLSSLVEDAAGNIFAQATPAVSKFSSALGVAGSYLAAYTAGSAVGRLIGNGFSLNGGSGNGTINTGAAIGAVVGGPIGSAIGAAVGGIVNRLFGRKLVDTGLEGTLGAAGGFSGSAVQRFDGGLFRSDKTVREALDPELQALLSGSVAGIKDATARYAAALGLPVDGIKAFTQQIQLSFKDLTQEQIQQLVGDTLTGFGKALVEPLKAELAPFIRAGEDASQTLARLSDSLSGVNPVLRELGLRVFDIGLAGADAAQQLIDGFGGASGFAISASSFYAKYFTEAERAARGTEIITEQLGQLGLVLPDTREAFRRLVEAQDLSTSSGRQTFTTLLGVADAFDEIQRVAEGAGGSLEDLAGKLQQAIEGALPKFLSPAQQEQRSLEQIVARLQAAGVNATIATLRNASKTDIFDFAQAFVAAGNSSEAAKLAVVEAASALADLKDAAGELTTQVAERLRGAIDSALPKFLSPTQQQERAYQRIVASLSGAGVQATVDQLRTASKDQIFDFAQAFVLAGSNSDAAKLAVVEAAGSLADLKDAAASLTDSLVNDIRQFNAELKFGDLSPLSAQDQLAAARALFEDTLARARTGDADARGNVTGNARAFLQEAQQFFGSAGFAPIFDEVQAALNALAAGQAGQAQATAALGNAAQASVPQVDAAVAVQEAVTRIETATQADGARQVELLVQQVTALQAIVETLRAQITQAAAVAEQAAGQRQTLNASVERLVDASEQNLLQGVS